MVKYKVMLNEIVVETKGTKTFIFDKPEELTWQEGSHMHIALEGYDLGEVQDKSLVRHLSISTLPSEMKIAFTTRVPGSNSSFKTKLDQLKVGDELDLFKIGSRMQLRRENRIVVLLSMGVGMATIRPILKSYLEEQADVPGIISMNVDATGQFLFKQEFDKIDEEHINLHWLQSRKEFYDSLGQVVEQSNAIYYIVGSDEFLSDVIQYLKEKKVKTSDIMIDKKEEARVTFFVE